ncbi:MAG: AsmA family protein [Candidatus Acidiferrales bacterium]
MKRWAKILFVAGAVIVAAIAAIPLFVNANTFRPAVEKELARALGRGVKVGELSLSAFSGRLLSKDLSVADDPNFSAAPFLTAKTLRIGVSLRALVFSHELELRGFEIESPEINLIRAANGTWNFSSIGRANGSGLPSGTVAPNPATMGSKPTAPAVPKLSVALIEVENARVVVATLPAQGEPSIYQHVDITVRDFSFGSRFPFEVSANLPGDGTVSAKGQLGPINGDDVATTPAQAQISLKHLDPVAAGFLNAGAGISLVADVETHAVSDGKTFTANGTAKVENLKLRKGGAAAGKPIDVAYGLMHQLKEDSGQIEDASIQLGDSAIHASGTYQLTPPGAEEPLLNLKLSGENLPINELQPLMTAAAVHMPNGSALKGGTLSLNLAVHGQAKALAISGPIAFANTRLVGFDVGSKIHGIAALSGVKTGDTTEFERLRLNMRMTNAGVVAENIDAVIGGMGELTGNGTVSPADQLDFNLILKGASAKGIGKVGVGLLSTLNGSAGGKSGVPIRITGTPDDPYITADVGGIFGRTTKSIFGKKN